VDGKLLFGMGGIKGVGGNAVEGIMEARQSDGPFTSLFNFCERIDLKRINRKTIEALIKAGALDCLNEPRARLFAATGAALERAQHQQRDREAGQSNLFAMLATPEDTTDDVLPKEYLSIEEWPEQELLAHEKSALGFYISGHPLDRFAHLISKYATITVDGLAKADNYSIVTLAGVQNAIRVVPFKNGKGRMAIIQFEDLTGSTEVIAMGDDFDRYEELLTSDEPLLLRGRLRIDRDEDQTKISIRLGVGRGRKKAPVVDDGPDVLLLKDVRAQRSKGVTVSVESQQLDDATLQSLMTVLRQPDNQGQCALSVRIRTDKAGGDAWVMMTTDYKVAATDEVAHAIRKVFPGGCALRIQ